MVRLRTGQNNALPVALLSLMMVVILFNSVLLARAAGYLHFPGELSSLKVARQGAMHVIEYSEKLASDAGVIGNSAVRDVLAHFKYEIERAATPAEIARLVIEYGRQVQEVILREQDNLRRQIVVNIINQDPNLPKFKGKSLITVSKDTDKAVKIVDGTGVLAEETKEKIRNHKLMEGTWSIIEISVQDGQATLVTARSLQDQIDMLEKEVSNLRSQLQQISIQAGYAEMTGSGIIVELYDAQEGYSSVDIVHDRDVRDVVNELFAAGAAGISVGGQRLIATSSIRCAGPIILVNQHPIAVNPIVIKAIGDPEVLASSLDLIRAELEDFGIQVIITPSQEITLPPYKEKK
ncbi:DUF881 domain-containing protein [Calderihabitans maritimus]|uniref:DUF881 domain-containing protein n=1 Tax=Calderihabitans maritimus TaxID=1246530 RepID=A0A1Z5HV79_9FIRM|nr:DUF881 domain-containing protein [Calderihabitans maritimus]GAW93436.1 hypothetical protein Hore_12540 [Calderihabitans maritimus]